MESYNMNEWKPAPSRRRIRRRVLGILVLGVLLVAAVSAIVFWDAIAGVCGWEFPVKDHFISSDYLTETGQTHTLASGGVAAEITFEIRNYLGLQVSDADIRYAVSVEPAANVFCHGDGVIVAGAEAVEKVTLTELMPGQAYTVTVRCIDGCGQTVTADFTVEP